MKVGILTIGEELLIGKTINTNQNTISKFLFDQGIETEIGITVPDDKDKIIDALLFMDEKCDLIITSGGLGLTSDDVTKKSIAEYRRIKLVHNEHANNYIKQCLKTKELDEKYKDADLMPEDTMILQNFNGYAQAGIVVNHGNDIVFLPGPPRELIPILNDGLLPYLKYKVENKVYKKTFKLFGIKEIDVYNKIKNYIDEYKDMVYIATYVNYGEITILLKYYEIVDTEAVNNLEYNIREAFKDYIYAEEDVSLEEAVTKKLIKYGRKVAVSESLTGGLLSNKIVSIPGASEVFKCGLVTYSNEAKSIELGIDMNTINKHNAVSSEVAYEMAANLFLKFDDIDYVISTTGFAGPTGGTKDKPVGTVFIAVGDRKVVNVYKFKFDGNRDDIREFTAKTALYHINKIINE